MTIATTPRVYVGTYAKYNNGSIAGAWLDLDDYDDKDAFYAACRELHEDEADPELMFQDWEGIPNGMVSECDISDDLFDYLYTVAMSHLDAEVFEAAAELDIPWKHVEDAYQGQYSSDEAFAMEYAENCGLVSNDANWPNNCIDWDSAARDLMYDFSEDNGHYFSDHY